MVEPSPFVLGHGLSVAVIDHLRIADPINPVAVSFDGPGEENILIYSCFVVIMGAVGIQSPDAFSEYAGNLRINALHGERRRAHGIPRLIPGFVPAIAYVVAAQQNIFRLSGLIVLGDKRKHIRQVVMPDQAAFHVKNRHFLWHPFGLCRAAAFRLRV